MCEKHLKVKEILSKSFQFLLLQINLPVSPYLEYQLQVG